MNARRLDRLAQGALVLFAALLLHEAVLAGRVFFERDVQLVWYGQVQSFVHAVTSGSWPLWDPYVAFGHPMLANPNTQVLYPFTWLNLLMRQGTFYTVYAFAHLVLGALGMYRLARFLGLEVAGAGAAAAVWIGSGPFFSLVNVWHHLAGASLIPWVLLAMERTLREPRPARAAAWGALAGLQVLAGSPDMCLMTAVVSVLRTLVATLRREGPAGPRRLLSAAALAGALAAAVSAGQWMPTLELTRESARARLDPGMRSAWSVRPGTLPRVVTPLAWTELPLSDATRDALFEGSHPFVRSLYLGLVPLVLVVAGCRTRSPLRVPLLALAGAALLYALGPATPFYGLATTLLPPLALMRYPSKAMVWVALPWALLAGLGLDALARGGDGRGRRIPAVVGALAALAAAGAAAWLWRPAGRLAAAMVPPALLGLTLERALRPAALSLAVAAALAAAVAVLLARGRVQARGAAALIALAAADLLAAHWRLHRTVPPEFYRFRPPILDLLAREPLPRLYVYRYAMFGSGGAAELGGRNPYRVGRYPESVGFDGGRALAARLYLLSPANAAFGVQGSFDPDLLGLYPRHLAELVAAHGSLEGTPGWLRLLQVGAVPYVEALHDPAPGRLVPLAVYESLLAEPIRAFAVPGALPRASFASGVRVASGDEAVHTLADASFDPRQEVVLPTGAPAPAGAAGTALIVGYRADRVTIASEAPAAGHVVLADTFASGWTATVDGRAAPLLRANVAFRAVPVPAGRHQVEMRYRPRSVLVGIALTAAGVVAAAVLAKRA